MAGFALQPFAGEPPADAALRRALALNGDDYLYLTATMALEHGREGLAPPGQRSEHGPQLVFHKALRHLMGQPTLTRTEERVALLRAARQIARTDAALGARLRHDVAALLDALADLAGKGIDLEAGLPAGLVEQFVHPGVCDLLRTLQMACRLQHAEFGRRPFEDAARAFLDGGFRPPPRVVMEGFTYLTPLQHHFATRCAGGGADVVILYPFRPDQAHGFAVMTRTYRAFPTRFGRASLCIPLGGQTGTALEGIQSRLFADDTGATAPPNDGTVMLEEYGHRYAEVAACVRHIRESIDAGAEPAQVAVVLRDASFRPVLQEEADRQALPVRLSIPPRMLLLTPVGRFVVTLYQVWGEGALGLDAEAFESLLTSGWLGAEAQATADRFNALRAQLFARCRAHADWTAAFARARALRDSLSSAGESRIPAGGRPDRGRGGMRFRFVSSGGAGPPTTQNETRRDETKIRNETNPPGGLRLPWPWSLPRHEWAIFVPGRGGFRVDWYLKRHNQVSANKLSAAGGRHCRVQAQSFGVGTDDPGERSPGSIGPSRPGPFSGSAP